VRQPFSCASLSPAPPCTRHPEADSTRCCVYAPVPPQLRHTSFSFPAPRAEVVASGDWECDWECERMEDRAEWQHQLGELGWRHASPLEQHHQQQQQHQLVRSRLELCHVRQPGFLMSYCANSTLLTGRRPRRCAARAVPRAYAGPARTPRRQPPARQRSLRQCPTFVRRTPIVLLSLQHASSTRVLSCCRRALSLCWPCSRAHAVLTLDPAAVALAALLSLARLHLRSFLGSLGLVLIRFARYYPPRHYTSHSLSSCCCLFVLF